MLTSKERADLRAKANGLDTTLIVGKDGVSEAVVQEAENLLREEQWSPEHISGHLKLQGKYISHETIYKMIRKDKMGRR